MGDVRTAGTTNHFGDLVDNIEKHIGAEASIVLNSIHEALMDGTPRTTSSGTPVDTGTLRANWNIGIRPNSNYIKRIKGTNLPKPTPNTKTYGIHYAYYLWNNSPYLNYVNDGIIWRGAKTDNSRQNINFVQKAIAIGMQNAIKPSAMSKIKRMSFF